MVARRRRRRRLPCRVRSRHAGRLSQAGVTPSRATRLSVGSRSRSWLTFCRMPQTHRRFRTRAPLALTSGAPTMTAVCPASPSPAGRFGHASPLSRAPAASEKPNGGIPGLVHHRIDRDRSPDPGVVRTRSSRSAVVSRPSVNRRERSDSPSARPAGTPSRRVGNAGLVGSRRVSVDDTPDDSRSPPSATTVSPSNSTTPTTCDWALVSGRTDQPPRRRRKRRVPAPRSATRFVLPRLAVRRSSHRPASSPRDDVEPVLLPGRLIAAGDGDVRAARDGGSCAKLQDVYVRRRDADDEQRRRPTDGNVDEQGADSFPQIRVSYPSGAFRTRPPHHSPYPAHRRPARWSVQPSACRRGRRTVQCRGTAVGRGVTGAITERERERE